MSLDPAPAPVWIVGPVTWDEVAGERVPGGAVLYAARTCEAFGVRASVLYTGGGDAGTAALAAHEMRRLDGPTLTLRHDFPAGERQQALLQPAGRTITPGDAPDAWDPPATLLLCPLLPDDVDVAEFLDEYPGAEVALLAQGLQRAVLPDGLIAHRAQPSSVLLDAARPNVSIFLSQEEVATWPAGAVQHLAARAARVVITRGDAGSRVVERTRTDEVPAMPARPLDTTGAGDVFAAALILALRVGETFAYRLAATTAAAAVEVRGPGALPSLAELTARSGGPAGPQLGLSSEEPFA